MMNSKLKKGDTVVVISGKDKGRQGIIKQVLKGRPKKGRLVASVKVIVEGINLVKKHVKPNPNANETGGVISMEAPLFLSKVAIFNPVTGKQDSIRYKVQEDGTKIRVFKKTGEVVDI